MIWAPALLVLGLVLLILGAELLVRGAVGLANALRISPLVTGLTIVAFATSSPELAIGLDAALAGESGIVVGNVLGSNISNVLLILGLAAAIAPLAVARRVIWLDVPVMIGVAFLLLALAVDGSISQIEGLLLLTALPIHTTWLVIESRREIGNGSSAKGVAFAGAEVGRRSTVANVALVLGGLGLLVVGAGWLVDGAVALARQIGVSELVIGLTIVAVGTSLPELTTSVVASIRGERDIAVGNVVGSNTWNVLLVLGLASALSPESIAIPEPALSFDLPVMIAVSVACLPIFFRGHAIARWEGALLLAYYGAYLSYLVLDATHAPALPTFTTVMLGFVVPITMVTILVLAARYRHPQVL